MNREALARQSPAKKKQQLYTIKEAAAILGSSAQTLYGYVDAYTGKPNTGGGMFTWTVNTDQLTGFETMIYDSGIEHLKNEIGVVTTVRCAA